MQDRSWTPSCSANRDVCPATAPCMGTPESLPFPMKIHAMVAVASLLASSAMGDERKTMIETQLRPRGIESERVLDAMARIPRENFVPAEMRERAYEDGALPIGHE